MLELHDLLTFLAVFAYSAGSLVCHQVPERSFHLAGRQLPVCARCTGLYLGAAAGVIGWLLLRRMARTRLAAHPTMPPHLALRVVLLAAIPTALSVATAAVGAWDGSNVIRAVLAVPLGGAAGAVVAAVASKDLR